METIKWVNDRWEKYEYIIPKHLICYLEYGDMSGLSDEDIKAADRFVDTLPRDYFGSVGMFDYSDDRDTDFRTYHDVPDILACDCEKVTYTVNLGRKE